MNNGPLKEARKYSPPIGDLPLLNLSAHFAAFIEFLDRSMPVEWEFYIQPHLNGLKPDLVLLHPASGVLVLQFCEKDLGEFSIEPGDGKELTPNFYISKDGSKQRCPVNFNPVERAFNYKDEIENIYCPRLQSRTALRAVNSGLVFPMATKEEVLKKFRLPLNHRPNFLNYPNTYPLICKGDLSNKSSGLLMRISSASLNNLNPDYLNDLRSWLIEPDFSAKQRRPLVLDAKQREIVNNPRGIRMRRMRGPAGSGKSTVIAARARKLATEGKDVLIVTYNITLINFIRDLIHRWVPTSIEDKFCEHITYFNFHNLCRRYSFEFYGKEKYKKLWALFYEKQDSDNADDLNKAELKEQMFSVKIPAFFKQLLLDFEDLIPKYDAILIDEAQDFHSTWWKCLMKLMRSDGEMLIAADASQDIYNRIPPTGFRGQWLNLNIAYRLPPDLLPFIQIYMEDYFKSSNIILPELDGKSQIELFPSKIKWVQSSKRSILDACEKAILDLVPNAGENDILAMPDVVFIAQSNVCVREMVERLEKKGIRVSHTAGENPRQSSRLKKGFYLESARVKATTIHSYKGLETRSLVIQLEYGNLPRVKSVFLSAITRIKRSAHGSYLTVVNCTPEFSRFGKLFPDNTVFRNKIKLVNSKLTSPE